MGAFGTFGSLPAIKIPYFLLFDPVMFQALY